MVDEHKLGAGSYINEKVDFEVVDTPYNVWKGLNVDDSELGVFVAVTMWDMPKVPEDMIRPKAYEHVLRVLFITHVLYLLKRYSIWIYKTGSAHSFEPRESRM